MSDAHLTLLPILEAYSSNNNNIYLLFSNNYNNKSKGAVQ